MRWWLLLWVTGAAWAATNDWICPTNGGSALTAANWSLGERPTNIVHWMRFDGINGSNTDCRMDLPANGNASALLVTGSYSATITIVSNAITFRHILISTGTVNGAGLQLALYTGGTNTITGGLITNGSVTMVNNLAIPYDLSPLFAKGILSNAACLFSSFSTQITITNCTVPDNGLVLNSTSAAGSVLLSNVTGRFGRDSGAYDGINLSSPNQNLTVTVNNCSFTTPNIRMAAGPGLIRLSDSTITFQPGNQAGGTFAPGLSLVNTGTGSVKNCTFVLTNATVGFEFTAPVDAASGVSVVVSNTTSAGSPWNAPSVAVDALTLVGGTLSLSSALSATAVSNSGTLLLNGYTVTSDTLAINAGVIRASNSTIIATNIVQTGGSFSNMTSTVQLSGTSNLTNYNNFVVAGPVTGTNALTKITGTVITDANGRSLDMTGGTLQLANPSTLAVGSIYNATVTSNKLFLLHGTRTNTTGQILQRPFRGNQQ